MPISHEELTRFYESKCRVIEKQDDLIDKWREALEIIAGRRQCVDNLLSNSDVARLALELE